LKIKGVGCNADFGVFPNLMPTKRGEYFRSRSEGGQRTTKKSWRLTMKGMNYMAFRLVKTFIIISICLSLILTGRISAESLTEEIWKDNYPYYQKILNMPFNRELSNGVLEEKVFKSYIMQDYFFLQNFRKVYGILLSKTPDEEGTKFVLEAIKGIDEELSNIHTVYFKKFNITNESLSKAIVYPNTEFYNSFLIKTATLEPFEVGLIATLPCHWIYYQLGVDMKKAKSKSSNKYQEWIDGYGTPSWETSETKIFVDLIERYLMKASVETRVKMKKAYAKAVKLEYMFWDGVYRDLKWLP
jgi:thiaminase (transcriptional activator TenA)